MNRNKDVIWYDLGEILSYNKKYNFIDGIRGRGKTFTAKEYALDRYIKSNVKTVWIRYNETQKRDARDHFLFDIMSKHPDKYKDYIITIVGDYLYIDGVDVIKFISITKQSKSKSVAYPDEYDLIIYDEYITEYTASEDMLFVMIVLETIERLRDNVKHIYMGNAITRNNPFYETHNIKLKDLQSREFVTTPNVVVHSDLYAEKFKKVKKGTIAGQMQMHQGYGKHSIDGEYLLDDYTKITGAKSRKKTLLFVIDGVGVWKTHTKDKREILWCSNIVVNNYHNVRFTTEGTKERMPNVDRAPKVKDYLSYHTFKGTLYYHTLKAQEKILEVIL